MLQLLKNRNFMKMYIANLISRFGDSLDMIAFGYMVYALTGSKVLLASIYVFNVLPNILFSTFSGTLVDFYSKKKIIICGDFLRGISVMLTAFLLHTGQIQTWHLFAFTFFNSTVEAFVAPAKFSTVPKLINESQYLHANSTMKSITKIIELIGIASAGMIIGLIGTSGALAIDSITFLISGLIISMVAFPEEKQQDLTKENYAKAYKAGLSYIISNGVILSFVFSIAFFNFLLTPLNAFMPAYVDEIMKIGPEGISYLSLSLTLGGILGGIIAGLIGEKLGIKGLIFTGFFFAGIFYIAMGLPGVYELFNSIYFICISAGLIGMTVPFAVAGLTTYLMKITPKGMMARLGSVINALGQIATPLGAFLAGLLVTILPLPVIMIGAGALFMITAFVPTIALIQSEKINEGVVISKNTL